MDFNVNVNVKFDATPALVGAVSTLAGVVKTAEVLQPAIIAPAIATSTARVEKMQETAAPVPQDQPVPVEKQGEITDEMLRKFVGPKSKDKGKEAIFKILDEFGVKRVPDLKQEQRQVFIDKVNAL